MTVRRERADTWPTFREISLPEDFSVLSIEVPRLPAETIAGAVEEAAVVLSSALMRLAANENLRLWLVAAGAIARPESKVAAYQVGRDGAWRGLEESGISLPPGRRHEERAAYADDALGFLGRIELEEGGLPRALEVTRLTDAVCLATGPETEDPLSVVVPEYVNSSGEAPPGMHMVAMRAAGSWAFIARAFGAFDDDLAGVEVYGRAGTLDAVESLVAAEGSLRCSG